MKTEAVKKITLTMLSGSDKSLLLFSVSVNLQLNSSKLQSFLNKELEAIWILRCSLIHAGLTHQLQENIKSSVMKNQLSILSDIIQADKLPEILHKEDSFIILTFHMMVTFGISIHQWNMMTKLIQRNLKELNDFDSNKLIPFFQKYFFLQILILLNTLNGFLLFDFSIIFIIIC